MNETAESLRARVHADHSFAWQRLTTWPVLGWLLRRGYLLLGLQVLSFALLVLAIVAGILQPDAPFGITLLLTWGIFWPLLTSVVTPTLGNAFCAVCPMGFAGKWLNKIGLRRRFPMRLRGVWLGLFTIMALYWVFPFVSLAALDLSTRNTALYFLGFVLCSFTLFYVYKDMAWCKQVCPLGRVLAAHGKVGVLAISTDQQACSTCKTFECAKACAYHLSPFRFDDRNNMGHCTLCTDCVTACDSAHLVVRPPGAALRKPILGSDRQEAWLFILILAVVGVGVQFQHFISHTPLAAYMPWTILGGKLQAWSGADPMYLNFAGMLILVCSLGLTISLSLWCYRGAARVAKRGWNETAGVLAVALAPLAIIGLLPHALTIFSTRDAHALVAEAGTLLGTSWQIEPLAAAGDPILQAISMLGFVGILWSLWLVWQRSVLLADTRMARLQIWAYGSLPVWFYTAILVSGVLSIAFMQGSAGGHAH